MEKAYTHYKGAVPFYGVDVYDQAATARTFEATHKVTYPSMIDTNTTNVQYAYSAYVSPDAVPTTLVIDKHGRVAARVTGEVERSVHPHGSHRPRDRRGAVGVGPIVQTRSSSGNLLLALAIAIAAGVVAFASPCVLPLVPGYLGYIGGFTSEADRPRRSRMVLGVALFVLGFTIVFIAYNWMLGGAGFLLKAHLDLITRIAGVLVIVMGLVFIGQFTFLQRTIKPSWTAATGLAGAPLLGIIFGLGWTPCIGPTLTAVLSLSANSASPWRGAILGLAFSLGLGIPFLLVALGLNWVTGSMAFLKRHIRVVNIIGGALLVAVGILMVSGVWQLSCLNSERR